VFGDPFLFFERIVFFVLKYYHYHVDGVSSDHASRTLTSDYAGRTFFFFFFWRGEYSRTLRVRVALGKPWGGVTGGKIRADTLFRKLSYGNRAAALGRDQFSS